jgi:hypothetical protein
MAPRFVGELMEEFEARKSEHNTQVRKWRESQFDNLVTALAPFFPETKRQHLERIAERLQAPLLNTSRLSEHTDMRELRAQGFTSEQFAGVVANFIERTQRVGRQLGWEASTPS